MKDTNSNSFAIQLANIFVIGKDSKPWISLPHGKGIYLTIAEERDKTLATKHSRGWIGLLVIWLEVFTFKDNTVMKMSF